MKIYWKKIFPFNGLYLILMSSFMNCFFSAEFKIWILGTPVNRSLSFFQSFSFIGPLNYTQKNRSRSQKLWPQANVQERVKKILGYKIGKWILYNKKIKINFFLKISPIYYVLTMHFGTSTNFQRLNIVSIYLKADCNKKWTFSSLVNLNHLKLYISPTFFWIFLFRIGGS
jgi:hypothetical protein